MKMEAKGGAVAITLSFENMEDLETVKNSSQVLQDAVESILSARHSKVKSRGRTKDE